MRLGNMPNWSIRRMLWLCFLPLVVILALMSLIFSLQIQQVDRDVTQVVDVQDALETIVQEMHITAGHIEQSISEYKVDREEIYMDSARESEGRFKSSAVDFSELATTDEEIELGNGISGLYEEIAGAPDEIIKLVDQQYAALNLFQTEVREINDQVDETLRATTDTTSPDAVQKLEATLDMAQSLDKTSNAIESYVSAPDTTLTQDVSDAQVEFQQAVSMYEQTTMSDYEGRWLTFMDENFNKAVADGLMVITITDSLHRTTDQFDASIGEMVSYLENTAQPLLTAQTATAVESVRNSISAATIWLVVLIIVGILVVVISVLAISRMIASPIRGLVKGAEIVDSGKLEHRFNVDAKGEFGELAFGLNRMLTNLQRSKEVLGESEETAWQILDSTTDSVILTDRRGFILASNEIAAERYGQSLEQMIDSNFYDLLPEDLQASRKAQITDVIRTGKPVHFEDEREGMILDHRIYPVHGARGEISRIAIFARDVTTHKWVEEVIEQLGRRNELILEAAGEGIYGLDTEGKTTFVNPAAARMLGYKPEDLIGQLHHELVHHSRQDGGVYPQSQCPIYAAFKDGTVHTSVDNEVFWRKDGTSFAVEYTSTPVIDRGNIVGAVVTFRDITERKRMESVLKKSEERYRSVFESAANLIISVNREYIILDCNNRSQEILGYAPDKIIGKGLLDLIHTDDREKAQVSLDEALTKGFDYHKRYRMIRKDGAYIDIQMNAAAAKDSSGKYIRTICMIDTTELG
ncbi:PAS domain S-box protein [Chloroflexota bacterium]